MNTNSQGGAKPLHTPTPWYGGANGTKVPVATHLMPDMDFLSAYECGYMSRGKTALANAAHIVHCVNSHDALVEALEAILANAYLVGNAGHDLPEFIKARAALQLAKEGGAK